MAVNELQRYYATQNRKELFRKMCTC